MVAGSAGILLLLVLIMVVPAAVFRHNDCVHGRAMVKDAGLRHIAGYGSLAIP
jgi:hypothetical protein